MNPTIQEVLAEMRARAEAASHGPWQIENNSSHGQDEFYGYFHHIGPIPMLGRNANSNSTFIAHARTDVPKLIAAVERAIETMEHYSETRQADTQAAKSCLSDISAILRPQPEEPK